MNVMLIIVSFVFRTIIVGNVRMVIMYRYSLGEYAPSIILPCPIVPSLPYMNLFVWSVMRGMLWLMGPVSSINLELVRKLVVISVWRIISAINVEKDTRERMEQIPLIPPQHANLSAVWTTVSDVVIHQLVGSAHMVMW